MSTGTFLAPFRWAVEYNGTPAAGALLYSYLSGTSTPSPLYSNKDLAVGHRLSNPVVADSTGTFPIMYMDALSYRIFITTSDGNTIFPAQDDIYDLWSVFTATTETANTVFAGPSSGSPAAPTFRALVAADIPAGAGAYTVINTTSVGSQNNFAPGIVGNTIIRCSNASDLTISGLSATGVTTGTIVVLVSLGAGNVFTLHQSGSSSAANQLVNFSTNSTFGTGLAAGVGKMAYVYDGTSSLWRLLWHQQGDYITYSAGTITGWAATPTSTIKLLLEGRKLTVTANISGTSNANSASFTIPYTPTATIFGGMLEFSEDATAPLTTPGRLANDSGASTTISAFANAASSTWTASGTKVIRGTWIGQVS